MKHLYFFSLTVITLALMRLVWPGQGRKQECAAVVAISMLAWSLASLLIYFPTLPHLSELLTQWLMPVGKWML